MAHLQAGHGDALAVIFDRYHWLVLSIAIKMLNDLGEAEDVMQSVFLEIYKVAAQFDPARGTTKAWLLQYAYHRAMNRRQHLKIRAFYNNNAQAEYVQAEGFEVPSGAGLLALPEVRRLIGEGLESLDPRQRTTIQLVYFEGLSLKDIAEQMGETVGNVRHHHYRGLSKLRSFVLNDKELSGQRKVKSTLARRGIADVTTRTV
jgi:RNA polymerase sigma-70 factor (ECF subfamily)